MGGKLTGGSIRVLWDASDSAEVTISGGTASWTVGGSAVTFPYTLSSSTTFETTHSGTYTVSVEHGGYEIAGTPDGTIEVSLRFGEQHIFEPSIDGAGRGDGPSIDTAVANAINTPASATAQVLSATIGSEVDPLKQVQEQGIISLIAGQPDEAPIVTGCTLSADTTNKRIGVQSWKMTYAAGATGTLSLDPLSAGIVSGNHSAVGVLVYIPDPSLITALTLELHPDSSTSSWKFNINTIGGVATLTTGWNIIRWVPERAGVTGTPAPWGTVHHLRLIVATSAATAISVQQVFVEQHAKARLLFIHDGGYTAWDQSPGYYDLRDRGIPVTWSIDCSLIGDATHVTEARLAEVAAENRNSIGFHGWDATTGASMTAADAQAHTMKAIKWLAARGYTGRIWRSAWLQNNCLESPATNSLVLANPMYGGLDNVERVNAWPFENRYNVVRIQLHGKTDAQFDSLFATLKANRGVAVCYTHRVDNAGGSDITQAEWSKFLSCIDQGVAEGWLEGTTLEMLLASSGVPIKRGLGGALTVEWPNVDGTTERMYLP